MYLISSSARSGPRILIEKKVTLRARLMLQKFGFDEPKLEFYRRRAMLSGARTMRNAPGGPDPQHHSKSPGLS